MPIKPHTNPLPPPAAVPPPPPSQWGRYLQLLKERTGGMLSEMKGAWERGDLPGMAAPLMPGTGAKSSSVSDYLIKSIPYFGEPTSQAIEEYAQGDPAAATATLTPLLAGALAPEVVRGGRATWRGEPGPTGAPPPIPGGMQVLASDTATGATKNAGTVRIPVGSGLHFEIATPTPEEFAFIKQAVADNPHAPVSWNIYGLSEEGGLRGADLPGSTANLEAALASTPTFAPQSVRGAVAPQVEAAPATPPPPLRTVTTSTKGGKVTVAPKVQELPAVTPVQRPSGAAIGPSLAMSNRPQNWRAGAMPIENRGTQNAAAASAARQQTAPPPVVDPAGLQELSATIQDIERLKSLGAQIPPEITNELLNRLLRMRGLQPPGEAPPPAAAPAPTTPRPAAPAAPAAATPPTPTPTPTPAAAAPTAAPAAPAAAAPKPTWHVGKVTPKTVDDPLLQAHIGTHIDTQYGPGTIVNITAENVSGKQEVRLVVKSDKGGRFSTTARVDILKKNSPAAQGPLPEPEPQVTPSTTIPTVAQEAQPAAGDPEVGMRIRVRTKHGKVIDGAVMQIEKKPNGKVRVKVMPDDWAQEPSKRDPATQEWVSEHPGEVNGIYVDWNPESVAMDPAYAARMGYKPGEVIAGARGAGQTRGQGRRVKLKTGELGYLLDDNYPDADPHVIQLHNALGRRLDMLEEGLKKYTGATEGMDPLKAEIANLTALYNKTKEMIAASPRVAKIRLDASQQAPVAHGQTLSELPSRLAPQERELIQKQLRELGEEPLPPQGGASRGMQERGGGSSYETTVPMTDFTYVEDVKTIKPTGQETPRQPTGQAVGTAEEAAAAAEEQKRAKATRGRGKQKKRLAGHGEAARSTDTGVTLRDPGTAVVRKGPDEFAITRAQEVLTAGQARNRIEALLTQWRDLEASSHGKRKTMPEQFRAINNKMRLIEKEVEGLRQRLATLPDEPVPPTPPPTPAAEPPTQERPTVGYYGKPKGWESSMSEADTGDALEAFGIPRDAGLPPEEPKTPKKKKGGGKKGKGKPTAALYAPPPPGFPLEA